MSSTFCWLKSVGFGFGDFLFAFSFSQFGFEVFLGVGGFLDVFSFHEKVWFAGFLRPRSRYPLLTRFLGGGAIPLRLL